jgi:DNA-binding transcriptional MerR regulator
MSIGQLSELTGVNIETIRYYEKIGLLPPASRAANGRRVYRAVEHRVLAFVRRSRELGFSLNDIRALLRLGGPDKASCREVREIAAHHLADIRARIGDLRKPCSRLRFPSVRALQRQSARFWISLMSSARDWPGYSGRRTTPPQE